MNWRKSSYSSGQGGNCVEVAGMTDRMAVRDSKDKAGPVLSFGHGEWSAFVAGIRGDGFTK